MFKTIFRVIGSGVVGFFSFDWIKPAAGVITRGIENITGIDLTPDIPDIPEIPAYTPSATTSVDPSPPSVAPSPPPIDHIAERRKDKKTKSNFEIIGAQYQTLVYNSTSGSVTQDTFDYTTYPDRAVVRLYNPSTETQITGVSIRGQPIIRMAGTNGFLWEYSDYQSIEETGERFYEIGNDYIQSADQCKNIGDYAWKQLQPHKMYELVLNGCHYEYEIGDVYTLTISYSLGQGNIEDINASVEVVAYSHARTVGGIGSTRITVRAVDAAWEATLSNKARLLTAGKPGWTINRSTSVTVASSTYCGPADYYCDGVDDDVQIQAAIDYLGSLGGGELVLTDGNFNISSTIECDNSINIIGKGVYTQINSSVTAFNVAYGVTGVSIKLLSVASVPSGSDAGIQISGTNNIVTEVNISNFDSGIILGGLGSENEISICTVTGSSLYGITSSAPNSKISSCFTYSNTIGIVIFSGGTAHAIYGNISHNNSGIGISIDGSNSVVSGNIVYSNGTRGIYIETGSANNVITGNRAYNNTSSNYLDLGTGTINSGNSFV
jgi:parallel beta-helix repeat protein